MSEVDLGRTAYNGYRAAHEVDDGGPFYLLSRDEWHLEDQVAWRNSANWVTHNLLQDVDLDAITDALCRYAEWLEHEEVHGRLSTSLTISGTTDTAYSTKMRNLANQTADLAQQAQSARTGENNPRE